MRRFLFVLALVLIGALGAMLARALGVSSRQVAITKVVPIVPLPDAIGRLQGALRIPTISPGAGRDRDTAAFQAFHEYLSQSFPRVHATMRRERIEKSDALLYTWTGTDTTLPPLLLLGHMDVVPVVPGTEKDWTHPPFGGEVAAGFVWGRGTLDDKTTVMGVLEACEALIAAGERPARSVILAFGADEEQGGLEGGQRIAALLEQRGVRPVMIVDEGGIIAEGIVPGAKAPVALVGIAEKGFVTLELTVHGVGGHSSMPPKHTTAGILARAVTRIEDAPLPMREGPATWAMLDYLAADLPVATRLLVRNRWATKSLLQGILERTPSGNASIRTTTAVTMLEGSPKDNVLPITARASVNFRLAPGDSMRTVLDHVRHVVDDSRVQVAAASGFVSDASPVSSIVSPEWTELQRTIRQIFPDALVAPYLVVGGTDARFYAKLTPDGTYRFAPMRMKEKDLARLHGTNERVSTVDYLTGVSFFAQLVRNVAGGAGRVAVR